MSEQGKGRGLGSFVGFMAPLGVLLLCVGKLQGVIDLPWLVIVAPLFVPIALRTLAVLAVSAIAIRAAWLIGKRANKRNT